MVLIAHSVLFLRAALEFLHLLLDGLDPLFQLQKPFLISGRVSHAMGRACQAKKHPTTPEMHGPIWVNMDQTLESTTTRLKCLESALSPHHNLKPWQLSWLIQKVLKTCCEKPLKTVENHRPWLWVQVNSPSLALLATPLTAFVETQQQTWQKRRTLWFRFLGGLHFDHLLVIFFLKVQAVQGEEILCYIFLDLFGFSI